MAKLPTCARDGVAIYRLAVEKDRCARGPAPLVNTPDSAIRFFQTHWGCKPQEFFVALYMNSRGEVVGAQEVSIGALNQAAVDPKVLFAGALIVGATAMIVCHNHPSGNPEASASDVDLTKLLKEGCRILSIQLLDHVIVARGGAYFSFAANGMLR